MDIQRLSTSMIDGRTGRTGGCGSSLGFGFSGFSYHNQPFFLLPSVLLDGSTRVLSARPTWSRDLPLR
jgi:hypothetical protein